MDLSRKMNSGFREISHHRKGNQWPKLVPTQTQKRKRCRDNAHRSNERENCFCDICQQHLTISYQRFCFSFVLSSYSVTAYDKGFAQNQSISVKQLRICDKTVSAIPILCYWEINMERRNPSSAPPSSRADRKTIERNRRNHMKHLFSTLNSLVQHQSSRVSLCFSLFLSSRIFFSNSQIDTYVWVKTCRFLNNLCTSCHLPSVLPQIYLFPWYGNWELWKKIFIFRYVGDEVAVYLYDDTHTKGFFPPLFWDDKDGTNF